MKNGSRHGTNYKMFENIRDFDLKVWEIDPTCPCDIHLWLDRVDELKLHFEQLLLHIPIDLRSTELDLYQFRVISQQVNFSMAWTGEYSLWMELYEVRAVKERKLKRFRNSIRRFKLDQNRT